MTKNTEQPSMHTNFIICVHFSSRHLDVDNNYQTPAKYYVTALVKNVGKVISLDGYTTNSQIGKEYYQLCC